MTTAVIPNWNGGEKLAAALNTVRAQTVPLDRVIVVDNGSTDGSADAAEASGVEVIRLERNTGFAHAVNLGIRASGPGLVAILNNDVELEPRWHELLRQALDSYSGASFAVCKIFRMGSSCRLDGAWDALSRGGCAARCGHQAPDAPFWNLPREVLFAPFTAFLARRDWLDHLGPLEESFESYLEDVDLGLRSAVAGFHGIYVPEATAWHWGSATLGAWHPDTVRRISRNQVYLLARHFPRQLLVRFAWPILAAQLLWGMVAAKHDCLGSYVRGKWQGMRQWRAIRSPGPPAAGQTVERILRSSEQTILDALPHSMPDRYWRAYFALTRGNL